MTNVTTSELIETLLANGPRSGLPSGPYQEHMVV